MAKRRYGRKRRSKSKSVSLAVAAPVGYIGYRMYELAKSGNAVYIPTLLTGINSKDKTYEFGTAVQTWAPVLVGALVHKGANRLGINSMVRRATMGYLSI